MIKNSLSMWRPKSFSDSMGFSGEARSIFSFVMRFKRYFDEPFSEGTRENMVGNRFGRYVENIQAYNSSTASLATGLQPMTSSHLVDMRSRRFSIRSR